MHIYTAQISFDTSFVFTNNHRCSVQVRDENGAAKTMKIQTWTWSKTYPSSGGKYVASAYFLA